MNDQTCRHGYHECQKCSAEELTIKEGAALRFEPTLVLRVKKDSLGLPVAWGPLVVTRLVPKGSAYEIVNEPKAGQVLVAVGPTHLMWQDPPLEDPFGVVRSEN